jgi:hypothetical protein
MSGKIVIQFNRLPELAAKLPRETSAVVRETAFEVQRRAQESMEGDKSGLMYGRHQASSPGEAPAVDTGFLRSSIGVRMTGQTSAEVAVGAEYGAGLEFGTAHILPRPFMVPAADAARPEFVAKCNALLESLK